MMRSDFAVFILSHKRADKCYSYETMRKFGYTGRIHVVIDNEDPTAGEYKKRFGKDVIVFDKIKQAQTVDACDNVGLRNSVVFARNANFGIARTLGYKYFLQLDDDYTRFDWSINKQGEYTTAQNRVKTLDQAFDAMITFLDNTPFKTIAFAQGGDFIGGASSGVFKKYKKGQIPRKAMNSFFFKTDEPVEFRGRVNDDVNLYVECGRKGDLFATAPQVKLFQPITQAETGGCTDVYKAMGTYVKSFYSVIVAPSCVVIAFMGVTNRRIHHRVLWKYACPVIVDEKHRKPRPV